ncbi:hypothetical protein ANN_26435 [Periplaneta americana]|uniref:Uncharacterized protein n=1 Tax=Periplaneta americana TaxID=6978 RepID=A0ABQ8RYA9_PERAM|nr:hypothetical protein ANN_26435 [Periplaneta americana]
MQFANWQHWQQINENIRFFDSRLDDKSFSTNNNRGESGSIGHRVISDMPPTTSLASRGQLTHILLSTRPAILPREEVLHR